MARKPRAAAQAAAQSIKNAPPAPEPEDEEMPEAPASHEASPVEEKEVKEDASGKKADDGPQPEKSEQPEEGTEEQPKEEAAEEVPEDALQEASQGAPEAEPEADLEAAERTAISTPAQDVSTPSRADSPSRMGGRPSAIPRKRRIGRPPKNRPPDWDVPDDGTAQSPNHVGTPAKRRRGRPAASGGRWARNRGPWHVTQAPLDKDGKAMEIANDEVVLPEDPEGETKIDKNGDLLDGREYRVRTFSILGRGDRKYMLSTEPARCIGFRDSYLFFQKHRMLYKIIIDDEAKRDLIDRDLIPHSYKGRAIGVVTARSVFREFGARIVVGGRKITDEYYVQAAREHGEVEGEVAVPEDKLPGPGETYNRNQYVAWHGASSVYHTAGGAAIPLPTGRVVDSKKRKITVTGDNWMLEHAREACSYNSSISIARRANLRGTYDVHTNVTQYPKIMQPTHARWERVPPPDPRVASRLAQGLSSLRLTNGEEEARPTSSNSEENKHQPEESTNTTTTEQPTQEDTTADKPDIEQGQEQEVAAEQEPEPKSTTPFPTVSAPLSRRFAIHDIHYETPPESNLGIPGPDGDIHDLGTNGLLSIAANPRYPEFVGPEILDELPAECREALLESAAREWEWKSRWGSETSDAVRATPLKSYAWFP